MVSLFFTMKPDFSKKERIKGNLSIKHLHESGSRIGAYPLLFFWDVVADFDAAAPVKIAFSVSKKKFKRAVDRNFLKRRMRESYRLNKSTLIQAAVEANVGINVLAVYTAKEAHEFHELQKKTIQALSKLSQLISTRQVNIS